MNKKELFEEMELQAIGFHLKNTKVGEWVQARINRADFYTILVNDEIVTIDSPWIVTIPEIKTFEKLTSKKYIKIGTFMDRKGKWSEWIKTDEAIKEQKGDY